MASAVIVIGWAGVAAGCIVLLAGLRAVLGELLFRARWKWGNAHKLKRSAKLGWNTGTPPDGATFLVLAYVKDLAKNPEFMQEHGWAVMERRGARCYAISGGMDMPVTNVTGWLEITP